jgi:type IV pilus assembly protein PilE
MKQNRGFTLLELMIVVSLVAILSAIAFPAYTAYVKRADRGNVQSELMADAGKMERYRTQTFTYACGSNCSTIIESVSPSGATSANSKYTISITPTSAGDGYVLLAVSTVNFDKTKTEALGLNEKGQRCYVSGASTCTPSTSGSWPSR